MTIKELYEIAQAHHIEDYDIEIQYRDGGGCYEGTDELRKEDITVNDIQRVVTL